MQQNQDLVEGLGWSAKAATRHYVQNGFDENRPCEPCDEDDGNIITSKNTSISHSKELDDAAADEASLKIVDKNTSSLRNKAHLLVIA